MKPTRREWAILAAWIIGVVFLLYSGTAVDTYKLRVQNVPLPHPYPWGDVALWVSVFTVEVLLAYVILRVRSFHPSWLRVLVALIVSLGLVGFFSRELMHGPPVVVSHVLLLVCASVVFFLLLAVSAVKAVRASIADRS